MQGVNKSFVFFLCILIDSLERERDWWDDDERRKWADLELADLQLECLLGFCSHLGDLS